MGYLCGGFESKTKCRQKPSANGKVMISGNISMRVKNMQQ